MDHGLGAHCPGGVDRLGERVGAVVAVRDDADLHGLIIEARDPGINRGRLSVHQPFSRAAARGRASVIHRAQSKEMKCRD